MGNRQRILESALRLFNEQGLEQVSVRDICKDLAISPGNFSYHFPDKSLLVSELYTRLTQEIGQAIMEMPMDRAAVYIFLDTHRRIFFIQQRYRFFYLNLFEILAHYPTVRAQYEAQYRREKQMACELFPFYIAQGVFAPTVDHATYTRIVDVGMILNNFWLVDSQLNAFADDKAMLIHYMQLCCGRLEPYLSPEARVDYEQYFRDLEAEENLGM